MPKSFLDPRVRQDMVFLRRLRQPDPQVLVDVDPKEATNIVADKGSVIPLCADGDEIYECMTHHREVCSGSECHHAPALNGGPLLFSDADDLPAEMRSDGNVLLRHSFQGREIKGVETFVCYGHAPCAAATLSNIRADQLVGHYLRGKDRVRRHANERNIPLKTCCFWMHIRWPNHDQRTYVFSRKAWLDPKIFEFRMKWRDEAFRISYTEEKWDKFWPQLKVA